MQTATVKVIASGDVANFVIIRPDGHELSLSSHKGSLIEWVGGDVIKDHGSFHSDALGYLDIVKAFLAEEIRARGL